MHVRLHESRQHGAPTGVNDAGSLGRIIDYAQAGNPAGLHQQIPGLGTNAEIAVGEDQGAAANQRGVGSGAHRLAPV